MPLIRTPDDLKRAFDSQLAAIRSSAEAYDKGNRWEAARLATSIHALVNDGGKNNRSILTQMGTLHVMKFVSSGHEVSPTNLMDSTPLVMIRVGSGGATYLPYLSDSTIAPAQRLVSFKRWWEKEPVYKTGAGTKPSLSLSRKRLVFNLRNKDGAGAHFDPVIDDEAYIAASQKPIWYVKDGDTETPLLDMELASMRQMAWELLETLCENKMV